MVFSVLVAVAGWRLAYSMYVKNTSWPDNVAKMFKGSYEILLNKYKVDEFYNAVFVDGLVHKLAKVLHSVADVKLVDGTVNGVARLIGAASDKSRRVQTGLVQEYAFSMGLGLAVLTGLYYILK
jgi:NADH-quinone oxidoreductase subunit L